MLTIDFGGRKLELGGASSVQIPANNSGLGAIQIQPDNNLGFGNNIVITIKNDNLSLGANLEPATPYANLINPFLAGANSSSLFGGGENANSQNTSIDFKKIFANSPFGAKEPPSSENFAQKVQEKTPFVSEAALKMLKKFEGFFPKTYIGVGAKDRTIGYGSSELSGKPKVLAALARGSVSLSEAEDLMLDEVQGLKKVINKHFGENLTPNQMGVLVSLAYNGGPKAIKDLKAKSGGNLAKVGEILPKFYVHSGGQFIKGLVSRRLVEQKLWNA